MGYISAKSGLAVALALLLVCLGCGGSSNTSSQQVNDPPVQQQTTDTQSLTATEVQAVINAAASSANDPFVIAVTDRSGRPLAVFRKTGAPATAIGNFNVTVDASELALSLARTAAYFSNDQAPLSSRTVRYLSGIHFPPGIANTENAPLYGIENTNRGCTLDNSLAQSLPPPVMMNGKTGLGMITGKVDVYDSNPLAVNPGGVPIYKNQDVAGAVGVVGSTPQVSEFAAFTAATSFPASSTNPQLAFLNVPAPGAVVINGITVPFVVQTTIPSGFNPDPSFTGSYFFGPEASPAPVPNGYLI